MSKAGHKYYAIAVKVYLSEKEYSELRTAVAASDYGTYSEVLRKMAHLTPIPYGYNNGYLDEEEYSGAETKEKS